MESLYSQVYQFGKLFQDCKAAVEDLFRGERGNDPFGQISIAQNDQFTIRDEHT